MFFFIVHQLKNSFLCRYHRCFSLFLYSYRPWFEQALKAQFTEKWKLAHDLLPEVILGVYDNLSDEHNQSYIKNSD